ncbi:MAG: TRAP transporter large permease subunit, partial [Pseudomonadota bacterium]
LTFILFRDVTITQIPKLLIAAVLDFSVPLFTVAGAGIFGWLIAYLGAAKIVVAFITGVSSDPTVIILMLIGFLILVGTVLNPISAVLIFLPIIQALGDLAGMNPVHMGVLTTITLSVGLITPPYGICLLIASQIAEVSLGKAMLAVLPIVGLTISIAILSVFFPDLVLGLPRLAFPNIFN